MGASELKWNSLRTAHGSNFKEWELVDLPWVKFDSTADFYYFGQGVDSRVWKLTIVSDVSGIVIDTGGPTDLSRNTIPKYLAALTNIFPACGNLPALVHTLVASCLDKREDWLCTHCIFIGATDWLPINYQRSWVWQRVPLKTWEQDT